LSASEIRDVPGDIARRSPGFASAQPGLRLSTSRPNFQYDTLGRLTTVINANNVTAASCTYDAFDRVATYTDSENWTATDSYDATDRFTKITCPDGTPAKSESPYGEAAPGFRVCSTRATRYAPLVRLKVTTAGLSINLLLV
jgi:YD repeat-containing protein